MARQNILYTALFSSLTAIQVLEPSGGAWPVDGKVLLRWRRSSTDAAEAVARIQYGDQLDGTLYPNFERRLSPAVDGQIGRDDIGEIVLETGLKECGGCWIRLEAVGLPVDNWGFSTFFDGSNGPVALDVPKVEEQKEEEHEETKGDDEDHQHEDKEENKSDQQEDKKNEGSLPPLDEIINNALDLVSDEHAQHAQDLVNNAVENIEELDLDQRKIDGFIDATNNEFPVSNGSGNEEEQEEQEVDENSEENQDNEQIADNEEGEDSSSGADVAQLSQFFLAVSVAASALL